MRMVHSILRKAIKHSRLLIVLIIFISLIFPIMSVNQQVAAENPASWWNIAWGKRQPINLHVSSGSTPQNYQILLNITYNSDMKNDFSDLRFISYSDNVTELDYWIDEKSDGNWALIWVEIADRITTKNQTLAWMYYGNKGANSNSNGDDTFVFFDDFEKNDFNRWDFAGSNWVIDSEKSVQGSYSAKAMGIPFTTNERNLLKNISISENVYVEFYTKAYDSVSAGFVGLFQSNLKNYVVACIQNSGNYQYYQVWYQDWGKTYTSDEWDKIKLGFNFESSKMKLWVDDEYIGETFIKDKMGRLVNGFNQLSPTANTVTGRDFWVDEYKIRKYNSVEPEYSFGEESELEYAQDNQPPSKVTGLTVSDAKDGKLDLGWDAATDNLVVSYYKIYRDGVLIATETNAFYQDTGLINNQSYTYQVSACDAAGNEGEKSESYSGYSSETPVDVFHGWVYGTVYLHYYDETLPARNAEVCLYPGFECIITNNTGEFIKKDMPVGTYSIQASKVDNVSSKPTVEIYKNTGTPIDLVIPVSRNRWEIEEAIDKGDLAGEISVKQDEDIFDHEIIIYETIDIETITVSKGDVSLIVSGDELSTGKTILINTDYNVFDVDKKDISVKYDGEIISLADDLEDVLDPNNDAHHPEYLVVYGADGIEFFVSIPHFSEHEINIYTKLKHEVTRNPEIVIFIAIIVIIIASYVVLRKSKEEDL